MLQLKVEYKSNVKSKYKIFPVHAMKARVGGVEAQIHSFVTSTLDKASKA